MAYTLSPAALAARKRGAIASSKKFKAAKATKEPQFAVKLPAHVMAIIDKECQPGEARWKAIKRLLMK